MLDVFDETSVPGTHILTLSSSFLSSFQQTLHPIYQLLFRAIHGNVIAFDTRDIDFLALTLRARPLLFNHVDRRLITTPLASVSPSVRIYGM
jgi:hypothetical protein